MKMMGQLKIPFKMSSRFFNIQSASVATVVGLILQVALLVGCQSGDRREGARSLASESTAVSKTESSIATTFESMLIPIAKGEVAEEEARHRLRTLSLEEMKAFVAAVESQATPALASRILKSYDVLLRRKDLGTDVVAQMLRTITNSKNFPKSSSQTRMELFLSAKAGTLKAQKERIDREFKMIASTKRPSEERLAVLGALTDSMLDAEIKPTSAQLESLLKSDIADVRIHAVSWFRMAPLERLEERRRFLKLAFKARPSQVREQAYRAIATIAASEPGEFSSLEKSESIIKTCRSEKAETILSVCSEIERKFKTESR